MGDYQGWEDPKETKKGDETRRYHLGVLDVHRKVVGEVGAGRHAGWG